MHSAYCLKWGFDKMTTQTKTLRATGAQTMHCGGCESTVKFTLKQIPGVLDVKASHKTQLVKLTFDPQRANLEQIQQELGWIGYRVIDAEKE
jgi:copper chaperone CopZ